MLVICIYDSTMVKLKRQEIFIVKVFTYHTYSYCIPMSLMVIIVIFLCPTSPSQVIIILIVRGFIASRVDTKNDRLQDFSISIYYFGIMRCG